MALTAVAGPVSNLLLATVFAILYETAYTVMKKSAEAGGGTGTLGMTVMLFFSLGLQLNVFLAVYNMLPVPPFDGSRFFYVFLPVKWYFKVMKYERYIMLGLMALILFESYVLHGGLILGGLSYLSSLLINGMLRLLELLPFFG
ncbi:MAG: site-2 protease family protein [Clostridia bacterium]|nr:site-2 protease family protein [Clostridia bacterium]